MSRKIRYDYLFLIAVSALSAVGLIMVFSASPVMALKHGDTFYFVKRHLFYLFLGGLAMYYAFSLDLEVLRKRAWPIFITALALLVVVFIPGVGRKVLGASRWIDLGLLAFQPSELMKIAMIIALAGWLAEKKELILDFWRGFLPPILLFGLVGGLIMKQPDMGTALTIGGTVFAMLFYAGARANYLTALGGIGIIGIVLLVVTAQYRFRRIVAYLNPWKDRQDSGFQLVQSLIAVGSGGFLGLGLGSSRQKYLYLPQQFTDFIFAILCEETGLAGAAAVIAIFLLFAWRGFRIAMGTQDQFKSLLAAGIISWLTLQTLINIMVVVGMIPTTGIPLPFISYGGTATIINLFAAGLVLNVSKK